MRQPTGGQWFIDEFVVPLLEEPESLRTLNRIREWTVPGNPTRPRSFEGWFHTLLTVRIEEAGFKIQMESTGGISPCGEEEHTRSWYSDIWFMESDPPPPVRHVYLKTQLVTPAECLSDIRRVEHLACKHHQSGVFVCVAARPRLEHPTKWKAFDDEVTIKAQSWNCNVVKVKPWLAVLWSAADAGRTTMGPAQP